jgi:hypothetical protein
MLRNTREMRCGRMDSLFFGPKQGGGTPRALTQGFALVPDTKRRPAAIAARTVEGFHIGPRESGKDALWVKASAANDIGRNIKRHRRPHIGLSLERCGRFVPRPARMPARCGTPPLCIPCAVLAASGLANVLKFHLFIP